jgi:hypothetical protein
LWFKILQKIHIKWWRMSLNTLWSSILLPPILIIAWRITYYLAIHLLSVGEQPIALIWSVRVYLSRFEVRSRTDADHPWGGVKANMSALAPCRIEKQGHLMT